MSSPLIIDLLGIDLKEIDKNRLKNPLVGGVILFTRNYHNRQQLTNLCQEIKNIRSDLLICVDQEGGRVQRFKSDGFSKIPAMQELGFLWDSGEKLKAIQITTAIGFILASELLACRVDFSFTPVLDLNYSNNLVINSRSFHKNPEVVTILASALTLGLLQAGMNNCGKHFPGHGFVSVDSHLNLPIDNRNFKEILEADILPFQYLFNLKAIMPAHIIFSQVDNLQVGFSEKWLKNILRKQLNFNGAIFSDDLGMQAAKTLNNQKISFSQSILLALNAGCDLILLCNNNEAIDEVLENLNQAKNDKTWKINLKSEERRLNLLPKNHKISWDKLIQQNNYLNARKILDNL